MLRYLRTAAARLGLVGISGLAGFLIVAPLSAAAQTGQTAPTTVAPVSSAQASSQITLNVDAPDGGASVANGQRVFVGGWAVAPGASNSGITSVDLFLDSPQGTANQIGSAKLGIDRPDVVTAFGHPEWRASGYNFDWIPRNLSAGPHTIYVVAHSTGGQAMTQAVQISGCGCGFVGSVTNPGVRKLGNDAWELDTGGPGVFIERPFDNIPGGN